MRWRVLLHESQEARQRARPLLRQVQVGNEDRVEQPTNLPRDRERRRQRLGRRVHLDDPGLLDQHVPSGTSA